VFLICSGLGGLRRQLRYEFYAGVGNAEQATDKQETIADGPHLIWSAHA
jgi:hypothetical protein